MSQILISDDVNPLDIIRRISHRQRELTLREAFKDFLKYLDTQHNHTS